MKQSRTKQSRMARQSRRVITVAFFAGLVLYGAWTSAINIPFQSRGPVRNLALERNPDLRDEIGWNDLVRRVANIRDSLPPEQQASLGVLMGDYGEQGAIDLLGPALHLPSPISVINSGWLRGYPAHPPTTLIVLGVSSPNIDRVFTNCRLAGHTGNSEGVQNDETKLHPDIYVCGSPRLPWPEFWKAYQMFG